MFTQDQLKEIISIFSQLKATLKEVDEVIRPIVVEAENQLKDLTVSTPIDSKPTIE